MNFHINIQKNFDNFMILFLWISNNYMIPDQ